MGDHSHNPLSEQGGGYFSREAVSGVPWMVVGKLIQFVLYFGISILTVNRLGQDRFGVYSLFTNAASYLFVLCGLGLGAALTRYIPELASRKNRFGLVHLLWKSAALQILAMLAVSVLLVFLAPSLQRLFQMEHIEEFRLYLILACGLTGVLLFKDYIGTVFIAFFNARTVSLLAVVQGVVWFSVLASWLHFRPAVGTVLGAQLFSVLLIYSLGALLLLRYIRGLGWHTSEYGIGKKRALSFSGTVMLSSMLRMVMFKYSEVFFIAAVGGTTLAGIYDLGYTLPYTLITFIPLSILRLFSSAFAEAYVKDSTCLGCLINSYYKLLIMVSLPIGIMSAWFAPTAYRVVYVGEMDAAGPVASAFSIVLLLPLISVPLSAAIKAKEKVLNMVPMLILQIVVNLFLDWLLIVQFRLGIRGGVGAVAGTFLLTIPFRLAVVRGILGGIYFPVRFFLKIATVFSGISGTIYGLCAWSGLFHMTDHRLINILFLFGAGGACLLLFLLSVRGLRLIQADDVRELLALRICKLNKVIDFFVR